MTGAMHGTGEAYLFEGPDLTVIKFIKEKKTRNSQLEQCIQYLK
jgi:hypothetical protein